MPYISYTIFADAALTTVRGFHQASGEKATKLLRSFADIKGFDPREGDIISGCRIDRIGSEDCTEVAL